MNARIKQSIDRIASEARTRYEQLLTSARARTEQAAGRISDGKKPLNTLTGLGLRLSAVSYRTTEKLLKQHTRLVENQLDTLALRLNKAADAGSVRELVGTQIKLLPEQLGRLAADTRASFTIVAKAGAEAGNVVSGTIKSFGSRAKAPARKKTARKTATKKARKSSAARKPAAARTRAARASA